MGQTCFDRRLDRKNQTTGQTSIKLPPKEQTNKSTMSQPTQFERCDIVVVGEPGVGKSATAMRFMSDAFYEEYDPTIEDNYRRQCDVDDQTVIIDVLDTAAPEEYSAMRDGYIRSAHGFVVLFSVVDRQSFERAYDYLMKIEHFTDHRRETPPVMLVGNKCDLSDERTVDSGEASDFVKEVSAASKYMECSAKTGHLVEAVFFEMVRLVRRYNIRNNGNDSANRKHKDCLLM